MSFLLLFFRLFPQLNCEAFGSALGNPFISVQIPIKPTPKQVKMLALVRKQLKNHPALVPLFFFIGGGAAMSMAYLARLALRNPDVSWDRKNNPEPWNKLSPNYRYKFYAVNMDYDKLEKNRPDF